MNKYLAHIHLKRWTMVALIASCLSVSASVQAADSRIEHRIKAAFLFNFARFIEWPVAKLSNDDSPFQICVYGDDSFGAVLDETISGKTVGEHPLSVVKTVNVSDLRACEIVYISSSESGRFASVINDLKGANTLLVNDHPDFIKQGGMIRFVVVDRKLRFEVNPEAAKREQLKISSKLLRVAKIVSGES